MSAIGRDVVLHRRRRRDRWLGVAHGGRRYHDRHARGGATVRRRNGQRLLWMVVVLMLWVLGMVLVVLKNADGVLMVAVLRHAVLVMRLDGPGVAVQVVDGRPGRARTVHALPVAALVAQHRRYLESRRRVAAGYCLLLTVMKWIQNRRHRRQMHQIVRREHVLHYALNVRAIVALVADVRRRRRGRMVVAVLLLLHRRRR